MNWEFLIQLSDTPALPGNEEPIRKIIIHELRKLTDEIQVDKLGNVIAHIQGNGLKLMLDAHMDEIGFMVSHIDDKGFIRVLPLGGVDPKVFYAQRVIIWGKEKIPGVVGTTPPHLTRKDPSEKDKIVPIEDCFIDTGLPAEKVHSLISVGDAVTFDAKCIQTENSIIGKALDDRIGLFMMLEAAKSAEKIGCDLYLVATTQEEVGIRGVPPAAFAVEPDLGISLEGTVANDIPGVPEHKRLASLGKGPEIRLSDGRFIADRNWVNFISELARKHDIPHQIIAKRVGGTNASAVQISKKGVISTAISIPVRYIHSPYSIAYKSDIIYGIKLVAKIIENASNFFDRRGI